jgi:hypothetical protein
MELKHINREISQLATMEATNYISEHGLEKLKEFRYLIGLHEEKVKKLTIPNVVKSFYCHDKTGGDCNDLGYSQCVECAIKQKMK